jgi:glycosyltransferase 2 family protein
LLATLVVFRILYFMIPFGIAISIMGTRELWLSVVVPWQQRRKQGDAGTSIHTETPEVVEVKATLPFPQRSRAGSRR